MLSWSTVASQQDRETMSTEAKMRNALHDRFCFTFLSRFRSTLSSRVKIMAVDTHQSATFLYSSRRQSRGALGDNIGNSPARTGARGPCGLVLSPWQTGLGGTDERTGRRRPVPAPVIGLAPVSRTSDRLSDRPRVASRRADVGSIVTSCRITAAMLHVGDNVAA